jgi:hypothetical protein
MNVVRRAKRSTIEDATSPAAPAANVYDDTINPNCAGSIRRVRINCGPSGMTIMKSTIVVNCTAARMSTTNCSRRLSNAASSIAPSSCIASPSFILCSIHARRG